MSNRRRAGAIVAVIVLSTMATAGAQEQNDRHAGYYYPPPVSVELYTARAKVDETATRTTRIGFVLSLDQFMRERPYPPEFSIFTKGTYAEKLIIVSNHAGQLDTVYRVRAMLATLTSLARRTPMFRKFRVETLFTFLDLLKLLGFTQVTVSDGDRFAHQIKLI